MKPTRPPFLLVSVCTATALAAAASAQRSQSFTEQRVIIQSEGWQIVGDVALPASKTPLPAVIMLNRANGNRAPYAVLAEQLVRNGIAALRLDLRAHGESTNLGRFIPGKNVEILRFSEQDVLAALSFLKKDKRIDPARIGLVGSSYSGEEMMEAGRAGGYVAAYVALSPGSLTDESIADIDAKKLPFLLVVARHERHLKEVAQAFRDRSRTGEFWELSGTEHATGLLTDHPGLAERLAVWFRQKLSVTASAPASDQPVALQMIR
jgi:dienelactone hydrolase